MPPDEKMPQLDEAACTSLQHQAWARFVDGQAEQAVAILHRLLTRLGQGGVAGEATPARQQALTLLLLGRVYYSAGQPALALAPLGQAIAILDQGDASQQASLSAALGDLANAHLRLGQLDTALGLAERALAIVRQLGQAPAVVVGLGQTGQILFEQKRYAEAEQRYQEALEIARQAGAPGLEGAALQQQGGLQGTLGNYEQAASLYHEARQRFQQAGDLAGALRVSSQLGAIERKRQQFDAAEACYAQARELAVTLNDRRALGTINITLSSLFQEQAEREQDQGRRAALLRQAVESAQEGLGIHQEYADQVSAAGSLHRLGQLYRLLGELAQAERHLEQGRVIYEALAHPSLFATYGELARVAYARGDLAAAAQWQIRSEAQGAELVRRGGPGGRMPPLVNLEPLLRAIAIVARGDRRRRAEIKALLPSLEQHGWRISEAARRIWAGERDLSALAAGLDLGSLALVARILQLVANPAGPPLLLEEESTPTPTPAARAQPAPAQADTLASLPPALRSALAEGGHAAFEAAFAELPPEQQIAVAAALGMEAEEVADDEVAEVPAEAEPLLQAIAEVARGDATQRPAVEEALARIEQQGYGLGAPVARIWAGERDPDVLSAGLDAVDAALVRRLLAILGS